MTESAESKCKRRLIRNLASYEWKYQYSVFPSLQGQDYSEDLEIASYALAERDKNFRRKLGEQFPDTAILFEFRKGRINWKFKTAYRKSFGQIYITFHTSKELDLSKLKNLVNSIYPNVANLKHTRVTEEKMTKSINTIKCQNLHSQIIKECEKPERLNRFSVINSKHLISVNKV
ncbi:MAG: hypothetical protein RR744_08870 [Cellulosilyticaceae bacterium]